MTKAVLHGVGALCVAASSLAQQLRTQESYVWDSVTIKGNGFINGIVYSPVQKDLVYMHTDMGGAYRWDQERSRWTCLTDWIAYNDWSLNQLGVETLAVDVTDANRVYIGAGTYMGPSAILRSLDQGRTWQRTDVPFGMDGNGSARNSGQRMMVDPNQPTVLLYGTRNKGLWKSDDRGATWKVLSSFPAIGDSGGPARNAGITWVLFDRQSGSAGQPTPVIYAGVATRAQEKVFRSSNAGASWEVLAGEPGGDLLPTRAALTPDGRTLYLTYVVGEGYPGPHGVIGGAVYRVDGPASASPAWLEISPTKGRFGWSGICIDPKDPQTVLTSVLCRYNPTDDIYRSRDGGKTWAGLNVNGHRDDSSAPYARFMGTHWVGDVQFDPFSSDGAMYTTGYGLYATRNATAKEPDWVFFNEGFEQSAVLELVSPPSGNAHLLSAIGDRDGYRHEDFTVSPLHGHFGAEQNRTMGTCAEVDIAWLDPQIVVRIGGRVQYSFDGGITWDWFAGEAPRSRRGAGNIALAADGSATVWSSIAGSQVSLRNGKGWGEWQPAQGLPAGASVVADLANGQRLYGLIGRSFFQSLDAGLSWTRLTETGPEKLRWLRAVMGEEGHLWAGGHGAGLFRSKDGGARWEQIAAGQISEARHVGIGAPATSGQYPSVFVAGTIGGLHGFFRSDDQGATWARINDDQHQYGNVSVIQGDSRVHGRLYVGANGRGILYGERSAPQ